MRKRETDGKMENPATENLCCSCDTQAKHIYCFLSYLSNKFTTYINKICFLNQSYMFRCFYIILREISKQVGAL
jgi:hypothetical protein